MFRYQIRSLRQILQPFSFYSVETTLFEKSTTRQNQRPAATSSDSWILNKISKLSKNELKNTNSKEWIDRINILKCHTFLSSECFKMITKHPEILQIPLKKFENTVKQWSCSNLTIDNFRTVLFTNPILLEIEHFVIRKRLPHLHAICGSSELVAELLINSPCVMFDDWNVLLGKTDYLLKVKGFKINSIVESFGLSRSLDFIKFRFDLLEKCGIYKQMTLHVHKINKYDQSQHRNPILKDILHSNDEYFSSAVAKISLEEYQICYELFMIEDGEAVMDSDDYEDDRNDQQIQ